MKAILKTLCVVCFATALFSGCKPFARSAQGTNWRYLSMYVEGFRHQLNYRANPITDSLVQICADTAPVRLCIYPEPRRYFVPSDSPGQVYLRAALINQSQDTVYLYQMGGLDELTTEIKRGNEWVNFQRRVWIDGHPVHIPVCPGCFVNIAVQLAVSGSIPVPYRLRLVTTKSVVFSNAIMVDCSKAQYETAGLPFAY